MVRVQTPSDPLSIKPSSHFQLLNSPPTPTFFASGALYLNVTSGTWAAARTCFVSGLWGEAVVGAGAPAGAATTPAPPSGAATVTVRLSLLALSQSPSTTNLYSYCPGLRSTATSHFPSSAPLFFISSAAGFH